MKYFVFFVLMVIPIFSDAQTKIKMEKDAGIYKVGCKVNGAPMKMYFDTGATVVSISRATAIYLYDNDLISKDDFIGKMNTATAEGAIVDNMLIRLKDVEIGGLHLKDVEAVVTSSLNAPLLLGQSVISRLGKISLEGDILTIHSSKSESLSKEQREEFDSKLRFLRANVKTDSEADYNILDIIKIIEKTEELNEFELFCKIMAEGNTQKLDEVIVDAETWIDKYALESVDKDMKMKVYFSSAESNLLSERGNKELGMQRLKRCSNYFENDTTAHFYWFRIAPMYFEYCKYKNIGYQDAINASKATIHHFMKSNKVSIKDINNNKLSDSPLQMLFYNLVYLYVQHYNWLCSKDNLVLSSNQIKMVNLCSILAAKLGAPNSIDYCREMKLDYIKTLNKKELDFIGLDY